MTQGRWWGALLLVAACSIAVRGHITAVLAIAAGG